MIRSFGSGSLGSHQLKPALVGQCTRFLLSGDPSIIDESIDSATKDCDVSSETLCNTLKCMKDQVLHDRVVNIRYQYFSHMQNSLMQVLFCLKLVDFDMS